jgi:hypothetical protein
MNDKPDLTPLNIMAPDNQTIGQTKNSPSPEDDAPC